MHDVAMWYVTSRDDIIYEFDWYYEHSCVSVKACRNLFMQLH